MNKNKQKLYRMMMYATIRKINKLIYLNLKKNYVMKEELD